MDLPAKTAYLTLSDDIIINPQSKFLIQLTLWHVSDFQGRHGLWKFMLRWLLDLEVYLLISVCCVNLVIHGQSHFILHLGF